ncbi:ammonium transporter Rh type A-like [Ornithodoros turicata]|uniref:ammonium transporter Rh type A-like n=1 Tax=Ornithodoros turicata TaxID=34597 RepID=UPI0031392CF1
MWQRGKLAFLLVLVQVCLIIAYTLCVQYDENADASNGKNSLSPALGGNDPRKNPLEQYYSMFQDVNVMVFVGFGFLMTFLRRYSYSALGLNLLLSAIAIQFAVLMRGVWHAENGTIQLSISSITGAEFAAASVLISFGAVLGKTSAVQLLVMAIIETVIFCCNEHLAINKLIVSDLGGSIVLHTFGAYFGLAVALVLYSKDHKDHSKDCSSYNSNVFGVIGTLFLWLFWPSFNAVGAQGDARHRAVLNTFLALLASTIAAFAMSSLTNPKNRFRMAHVQNSTLAGGVAMGAVANMMVQPYGAFIIGFAAGCISVLGFKYLGPLLTRRFRLHDTCGVHNLHGLPGVLAGLVSAIVATKATEKEYNYSLYTLYPARAPTANSSELNVIRHYTLDVSAGLDRSASQQALYQLAALAATLVIAVGGGLATGLLLKLKFFDPVDGDKAFDDFELWEVEAEPEAAAANARTPVKSNQIAMAEQVPDSARGRLPAHFNGAYDVNLQQ